MITIKKYAFSEILDGLKIYRGRIKVFEFCKGGKRLSFSEDSYIKRTTKSGALMDAEKMAHDIYEQANNQ